MKNCYNCKLDKSEEFFAKNKRRPDGLQSQCKSCQKLLRKKHYSNNISKISGQVKNYRLKIRQFLISLKESSPCLDCNKKYPYYVMDFDHKYDKKFSIGNGSFHYSEKELLEEIEKCDLVCANCHRERTHKRRIDILVVT